MVEPIQKMFILCKIHSYSIRLATQIITKTSFIDTISTMGFYGKVNINDFFVVWGLNPMKFVIRLINDTRVTI